MINRGSEWKKWDLHVHTPASIVHDYKKGNEEDIWSRYFKELEELPDDIKVLGINDYWFLNGYEKVKQYKESGGLPNIELILPVVEFRLRDFVGTSQLNKINYHIIFSNELSINEITEEFLKRFEITAYENRSLSEENLIAFGEKIRRETPADKRDSLPSSGIQVGFNNFTIPLDKINELLSKSLFEDKFIRVVGQTEWNDFRWDGSPSDKKALINGCDFVFSASPSIENAVRSKKQLIQQEVNNRLLHCSDAHEFFDTEYTSKVLGHCYSWIKADSTFDGLKQAIYEPERINLSIDNPNKKNSYQYINNIKIMDDGTLFGEQNIGLSPDLNSIIGGKSSGKSLLLYHLAKTVMNHDKFKIMSSIEGFQTYDSLPRIELEATWADGHISRLFGYDDKRPVVFIPQMYLNYMAEKKSRNEDFKQTIDDILKTNDGYKEFIESKRSEISNLEQLINTGIKEYFVHLSKSNELNKELSQLGDVSAIQANITRLENQLDALKETSGFTNDEVQQFATLHESNKKLIERKKVINLEKELLSDLSRKTIDVKSKILPFLEDQFSDIQYKYKSELVISVISQLNQNLSSAIESYVNTNSFSSDDLNDEIVAINEEIEKNNRELLPLNQKAKNLEALKEKQKELNQENEKVVAITLKIEEIVSQETRLNINSVLENYVQLMDVYGEITNKHDEYKNISESIDLVSEISFNIDSFQRDFSDYITKNRALQTIFEEHGFVGNNYTFNLNEHIENVKFICQKILNDVNSEINFNQGKQKYELINALLNNYFDISYDLMQGNDRLGHMSPGKKGIILFQLFLHMSSSQDPILIDQPEDNLDNRTVYKELNDFIKEKKLKRQIIIVSHNSNLVVSTDSENVIVAHQNGSQSDVPRFQYINGALENTFIKSKAEHILEKQGIREHVCEILEGGVEAFKKREKKYNI